MLLHDTTPDWQPRLRTARRILGLIPVLVFLLTLIFIASTYDRGYLEFLRIILQSVAASLASSFVSIAVYGFYRYLVDRSPGL